MATSSSSSSSSSNIGYESKREDLLPLVNIQYEIEEMGKALKCPICQSSLNRPCLLPCLHAFCHDCIHACSRASGCPICKASIKAKRSIQPSNHLHEIVMAYKHVTQAFGLAPIVYSPTATFVTTQLSPDRITSPSLAECKEHWNVSICMKEALRLPIISTTVQQHQRTRALLAAQDQILQMDEQTIARKKKKPTTTTHSTVWTLTTQESATANALRADEAVNQSLEWLKEEEEYARSLPCSKKPKTVSTENKENVLTQYNNSSPSHSHTTSSTSPKDDNIITDRLQNPSADNEDPYCQFADKLYEEAMNECLFKKTIHVVMSNVSDYFKELMEVLVVTMKRIGITIKVQNEIYPGKTSLCVTPMASDGYSSQFRTLKTMRASLWSIPIVSTEWITQSLQEKQLVIPKGTICIRMLPPKHSSSIRNGVAISATRKRTPPLLHNVGVCLCGGHDPILSTLLRDCGAKMMSIPVMLRQLGMTNATPFVVVLCNTNNGQDISPGQFQKMNQARIHGCQLFVVSSVWLFDCISTSSIIQDIQHYAPDTPKAKELWDKLVTGNCYHSD